jgi:SH3 domain-containing protein
MTLAPIARWIASVALLSTIELAAFAGTAQISGIEKVYLRAGPGTDSPPLGVLNGGDQVNVLGVEGSWTKVETRDGRVGFVYRRYVVPELEGSAAQVAPEAAVPPGNLAAAPTAALPAPSPTETVAAPKDELSAELANLRAEVADLKQKVQEKADQAGDAQGPSGGSLSSISQAPVSAPAAPPASSARDQGVGVLAVAFLSLLVGWVLGSAFGRRRSRSQRPRLRL